MSKRRKNLSHRGVALMEIKGKHVARWTDPATGKRVQRQLDGLTGEGRLAWARGFALKLANERAQLEGRGVSRLAPVTISDAIAAWWAAADLAGELAATTRGTYATVIGTPDSEGLFSTWCKLNRVTTMGQLNRARLRELHRAFMRPFGRTCSGVETRKPLAPATKNVQLRVAKAWLRWCRRNDLALHLHDDDIADALPLQREIPRPIRFLDAGQVAALIAAARRWDADGNHPIEALCRTLLLTGMRISEACSLAWSDVDLPNEVIRLRAEMTKARRPRLIDLRLSPSLLPLLASLRLRAECELVFAWNLGAVHNARPKLIRDYAAPAFTWHDLRRTCGSIVANLPALGGASHRQAANRLGHSAAISERLYQGALRVDMTARTLEEAMGLSQPDRPSPGVSASLVS